MVLGRKWNGSTIAENSRTKVKLHTAAFFTQEPTHNGCPDSVNWGPTLNLRRIGILKHFLPAVCSFSKIVQCVFWTKLVDTVQSLLEHSSKSALLGDKQLICTVLPKSVFWRQQQMGGNWCPKRKLCNDQASSSLMNMAEVWLKPNPNRSDIAWVSFDLQEHKTHNNSALVMDHFGLPFTYRLKFESFSDIDNFFDNF